MNSPIIQGLAILFGFIGLIFGADKFVHGASTSARHLGISPLVIGLTIVAFGTSAPEIFTSAVASLTGAPEISIGNVLGSNIANIGLILGCTALAAPLIIPATLMKQEIPILTGITLVCIALFYDGMLDSMDGFIILLMLAGFCWQMFRSKGIQSDNQMTDESDIAEYLSDLSPFKASMLLLAGLILMIASSNILVWGAHNIAMALGMSELVIGLTIVAIGTSLPELATSMTSALKGHHELAIGNVVGSNILNLLLVLPIPAFLSSVPLSPEVLSRDYPVMLGFTLLLAALIYWLAPRKGKIGRKSGAVFIILYLAYTAFLIYQQP